MEKLVLKSENTVDCYLNSPAGKLKVRIVQIHQASTKDCKIQVLIPEKNWYLWVDWSDLEALDE